MMTGAQPAVCAAVKAAVGACAKQAVKQRMARSKVAMFLKRSGLHG